MILFMCYLIWLASILWRSYVSIHQEYWLVVFYYSVIHSMLGPVRALSWAMQKPGPWAALKKLEN